MKSLVAGFVGGFIAIIAIVGGFYLLETLDFDEPDYDSPDDINWTSGELREAVIKIEHYKLVFGFYPEDVYDAVGAFGIYIGETDCGCGTKLYHYERLDEENYTLFAVGPDCKMFTGDDIFPDLNDDEGQNVGFRKPAESMVASVPESDHSCEDT